MTMDRQVKVKDLIVQISTLFIVLALCACTSHPARDVRVEDRATGKIDRIGHESGVIAEANKKYSRGDYAGAADLYRQLSNTAESEIDSQSLKIKAADAYARAGHNELARKELKFLDLSMFTNEQRLLYKIIEAQMSINEARSRDAFGWLPRDASNMSLDTQVRLGTVRADAWLGLKRYSDAVLERIDIDPFITIPEERTLNHQWIWNQLQNMPRKAIFSPPMGMSQDDAGWWSLATIVKKGRHQKPAGQYPVGSKSELDIWKETYPGHPASEDILFFIEGDPSAPVNSRGLYSGTTLEDIPRNVALLLPLSGHFAEAGRSVLNGFRQAANESFTGDLNYKVYDSADVSHSLGAIANQAVMDGAEMIIGPLQKSVLSSLLSSGDIGVPILALNTLPDNEAGIEGLYQFSLSPENEAVEVARRALIDGRYRAVVLASEDAIGERTANAFMRAYEQEGGHVVAYDSFPPKSNTISQVMKRLLRAESADPLWEDVRKGTERQQGSEQKIDMIFFTASPRDSRIVRPIVQLHRAYDLPVYSSARVYSHPDPVMDKDLNGLVFCDMPDRMYGGIGKHRLSALGADAYRLVSQLHGLTMSPGSEVSGETGRLSVTPSGLVWRHLDCAVFRKGKPELLP